MNVTRVRCAFALTAVLALSLSIGCDRKEPAKPNIPKPPTPDVTPKASSGASVTATPMPNGGGAGLNTSPASAPTTRPTVAATTPPVDAPGPLVTSTDSAKHAKEAQDLVAKAIQALKENKLDDAKGALDKVDAMGNDVPKATREQATTVRRSLDNAQKLQKAPDLPVGASNKDEPNK